MAYNLNQAAEKAKSGMSGGIFADGVKSRRIKAWSAAGVKIRLLPAFAPGGDPNSYIPFRDMEGSFSTFARLVPVYDGIGHGEFRDRKRIVSAKAHGHEQFCILEELSNHIKMSREWQYLHQSPGKDDKGYDISSPFPKKAKYLMIANVVDVGNQSEGAYLAECSVSVFNAMNTDQGVLNVVNPAATEESVAQNHLSRWAAGDITCPVNGPVLRIYKDDQSKGYAVAFSVNQAYQVEHLDVRAFLPGRVNLEDENFHNVIPPVREEDQIKVLLDCLRGYSPSGRHEWELLKEVYGQRHSIPNPPSHGGGAPNPVTQQPVQATESLGASPAAPAPGLPPVQGGVIPGMQPPAAPPVQQAPAAPPAQPPVPAAPPVQTQPPVAQQPVVQQPTAPPAEAQPPVQATQPPVAGQPQGEPQVQQQAQAEGDRPAVPGKGPQFDTNSFLDKLKEGATPTQ